MWNLITNPIVSHFLVAAIAGAGTWWTVVKTRVAKLEAEAHTELTKLLADVRAEWAAVKAKV
jgi:hypothetical protein